MSSSGENLRFSLKDECLLDLRDKKLKVFYLVPPYTPSSFFGNNLMKKLSEYYKKNKI